MNAHDLTKQEKKVCQCGCGKEVNSKKKWARFATAKCRQQWNKEEWAWGWVAGELGVSVEELRAPKR